MSLSELTDTELETLKDNLLGSINRSTNAQKYSTPGDSLERMSPREAMDMLKEVNEELFARSDRTGGIGVIEFEDPV